MDIIASVKSIDFFKETSDLKLKVKKIKEYGISTIRPHVLNLDENLDAIFEACSNEDLELHPWIKPGFGVCDSIKRKLSMEDLAEQEARFGTSILRDCLNNSETLDKGVRNISKFLERYRGAIKGLHLDYVRNDNALFLKNYPCQCEACQKGRMKWLGHGILTLKDLENPAVIYKELQMRNRNITNYVRKVRDLTQKEGIKLSLAARANYVNQPDVEKPPVFGLGPAVYEGQDWLEWAEEGLFDFISTMNYYTDLKIFADVAREHARLLKGSKAVFYSGIGIESSIGNASPETAEKLIAIAKEAGAEGITLFHFEALNESYKKILKAV
jgi:hypothetical protein